MKKFYSYLLAAAAMLAVVVATGCTEPKPEPTPEPKPEVKVPEIALVLKDSSVKAVSIEVAVKNASKFKYAYYVKGERPATITWEEKAVEADGKYFVAITGLTVGKTYDFEAFAANAQDSVSKALLLEFTVVEWSPLTVSEVKASPTAVSFNCNFLPTDCDGFFYVIKPKADYNEETFLAECKPVGEGQVFSLLSKKSGLHKNQEGEIFLPETDYVVAVVGAKLTSEGVWTEFIGPVLTFDIKTIAFAVNQSTANVSLAVDKTKLSFSGVPASVTRVSTSVMGYYRGAIKTSELAGSTLDAKVSEWLGAEIPNQGGMCNYDDPQPFFEEMIAECHFDLEENTEYTIFVVPFDDFGMVGKVASDEVTTPALAFDGEANVTLKIVADINVVDFTATFNDGCVKALYITAEKGQISAADAQVQLLEALKNEWSAALTPDAASMTFDHLSPNTDYETYLLPIGSDGKLGPIQHKEYKTIAIDFSGAAKMTVTASAPVFDMDNFAYKVEFTLNYSEGATQCEYALGNPDPGTTPTVEELTILSYQDGKLFQKIGENKFEAFYGDYNNGQHALFVPMDADGKRGAPVSIVINVPANPAQ